jgi:hypothetical protein
MAGFADEVGQWSAETQAKMELAVRKIALDVFTNVILMSPVDTGRFRGNWQVAIGTMASGTLEINDKDGTATIGKVQAETMGLKAGQTIFLVNNLPYAQALEYGLSQQAPGGMVRLTAQRFQPIVDAISRQLSQI